MNTLGDPPEVACCDHRELAAALTAAGRRIDALITDCPYSDRTHGAHDRASADSTEDRRGLNYGAWTHVDVARFVAEWSRLCDGWFVSITDTELASAWAEELRASGRYVFSPLACVQPGSRVRIMGDGPAQWSVWAIVARPRTARMSRWGALPGAYIASGERSPVVGGKPLSLMRALVRDYSRPGDLVCDPCAGAGTTLVAARMEGRRAIGCDKDPAHVDIARRWLAGLPPRSETQRGLFDDDTRYEGAAGQQERRT